jgi:hypothetical protein
VLRTGVCIASSPPLGHHHSYIYLYQNTPHSTSTACPGRDRKGGGSCLRPLGTDPVTLDEADFGKEKNGVQGWRWLLQVAHGKRVRRLWIVQEQLLKQDLAMLHGFSLCPGMPLPADPCCLLYNCSPNYT